MKIALLSPIAWRTPPRHYGPWESVVSLLAEGLVPPEQERVLRFQRTFLENVRRHGRVNELELMARFKAA